MPSTLVAGYVVTVSQAPPESDEMLLARKRCELEHLSPPPAEFRSVVAIARELDDAQFSNPQQQLKRIVDFMVGGVEAILDKRRQLGHHVQY